MATKVSEHNQPIVEEFRANEGKLGGNFEGAPMLLLHTTGRKSGVEYVNPVMYQQVDEGAVAVFATKGGAPTDPDWYRNAIVNPDLSVEIGTKTLEMRAHEAEGAEREKIWTKQKRDYPAFAEYEKKTKGSREIPVIVLERVR